MADRRGRVLTLCQPDIRVYLVLTMRSMLLVTHILIYR